jgi:hypothetical protein
VSLVVIVVHDGSGWWRREPGVDRLSLLLGRLGRGGQGPCLAALARSLVFGSSRGRGWDICINLAEEASHEVVVLLGLDNLWFRLGLAGALGEELADVPVVGVTLDLLLLAGLLGCEVSVACH